MTEERKEEQIEARKKEEAIGAVSSRLEEGVTKGRGHLVAPRVKGDES
jgi:hypothetical protein